MKKLSLLVILLCLALIGLLARKNGAIFPASLPTFVTDAVSADSLPAIDGPGFEAAPAATELAAGQELFERECTLCHSAPLVFKSQMLSGEVDSLVAAMLRKNRTELPERDSRRLAVYLKSRLPKN